MNRKVILILADGMRPDTMENLPYAKQLIEKSAYTMNATTTFPSVTLSCHFSLFLSVPPERHGISTNTYTPPVRPIDGLFEKLFQAKKTSAVFYSWEPLRDLWRPVTIAFSRYERKAISAAYGPDRCDINNTSAAIEYICKEKPDFTFLYLGDPDWFGHVCGWETEEYRNSVVASWEYIEKVVEEFKDEYTFIITADHGGHDRIHGTDLPEDMTIPLILQGPDFQPGEIENANILDIAPTIAKLIGVDASDDWEGKALI